MVSSRVPNASGRLDIGQCMSKSGSTAPDFERQATTPGIPDNRDTAGGSTTRMTRAPRAAIIGT